MSRQTIFYGAVVSPVSLTKLQALPRCLLAVSVSGSIDWLVEDVDSSQLQEILAQKGLIDVNIDFVELKTGQFLLPGFIDTHIHAPQIPNAGSGQQYQLLEWLKQVTFPMEARFKDVHFAAETYKSVVRRTLDSGTTTCCYYGTLHVEGNKILANTVHDLGQRAFIGKCNMNRECVDYYEEASTEESITGTKNLISHIRSLHSDLVKPILTPRFAISCTDDLLNGIGKMAAADPTLHIQTHIAENQSEVAYTRKLFPSAESYADVYNKAGLLRHNTVLAHGIYLDDGEVELIRTRRAGISHCPTSNFNLSSGIAPVGKYLDRGIKVGLGTDVSGGFSLSMLTAIQHASIAAKVLSLQNSSVKSLSSSSSTGFENKQFSLATLLHLATLGGAQVCDMEKTVGSFAPGKDFDALLVDLDAPNPGLWSGEVKRESVEAWLERFMFCGDDRNISRVYVQGQFVGGTQFRKN